MKKSTTTLLPLPILPGNWRRPNDDCVKNSPEIYSHEDPFCHRLTDLGTPARPTRGTRSAQKAALNGVTSAEVADDMNARRPHAAGVRLERCRTGRWWKSGEKRGGGTALRGAPERLQLRPHALFSASKRVLLLGIGRATRRPAEG